MDGCGRRGFRKAQSREGAKKTKKTVIEKMEEKRRGASPITRRMRPFDPALFTLFASSRLCAFA